MTPADAGRRVAPVASRLPSLPSLLSTLFLLSLLPCLLAVAAPAMAMAQAAASPASAPAPASASANPPAPRIAVATMQPGEIFFERFGHNALVVVDPRTGQATSYNFGYFDMDEDGFTGRFVAGDMRYRLVALPLEEDLAYYRDVGRGVDLQWLDLDDARARRLADALAENAKPENATYRYDYFADNCSTRVRDALDAALDGGLRRQLETRSQGNTYRSEAVRLARPAWWMRWGFDFGLGPAADVPNALWQDAFVPMRLAAALREVRTPEGRPLVQAEETLVAHRLPPEPVPMAQPWLSWLVAGVAFALAIVLAGRRDARIAARIALPFWAACALLGSVSLLIWLGTEHRFGWGNRNLLLASPLCLLLLPGAWRIARGRAPQAWFGVVLAIVATLALPAPFLLWLPQVPQRNAHWIALLLPLQVAFVWTLWPRARGTERSR